MRELNILAYYSWALNKHQRKKKLELLTIVEILSESRTMLLGLLIVVHMDHENLICPTEINMRVKRWKFILY